MKSGLQRIAMEGEMTIGCAQDTRQRLLDALARGSGLEVDLAQVSEIDSAGLQQMIALKHEAAAQGKALSFVGHSPAVLALLDLTDLGRFFGDPVLIDKGAGT